MDQEHLDGSKAAIEPLLRGVAMRLQRARGTAESGTGTGSNGEGIRQLTRPNKAIQPTGAPRLIAKCINDLASVQEPR